MNLAPETARRLAAARDIAAVLAFCAVVYLGGSAVVNSPYLQKERLTGREAAADINAFFAKIDKTHPLPQAGLAPERWNALRRAAQAEAEQRLDEFGRITVRDLAYVLYKAGAGLGDPNTRPLWRPRRKWKDPELKYPPFTVDYRFGKFVVDAAADGELAGAELTAVDGAPFETFIAPLLERVSGADPRYRRAVFCAEQGFWWDISGLLEGKQSLRLRFKTPGGKVRTKEAPLVPAWEFRRLAGTQDQARPRVVVSRGVAWVDVPDMENSAASRRAWKGIFTQLHRQRVSDLVLDLRRSKGADYRAADLLLSYLDPGAAAGPEVFFHGRTLVILGPGTAGAAALFAGRFAALKVGETLGEESAPAAAWGEEYFKLPNSGVPFSVSSRRRPARAAGAVLPGLPLTPELLRGHADIRAFALDRAAKDRARQKRAAK